MARLGWTWRAAFHDVLDLIGINGFPFHQGIGHHFDLVTTFREDFFGQSILVVQNLPDLLVDLLHRHVGQIFVRGNRAAQKHFALIIAIDHRAQGLGHPITRDHIARDAGGALKVIGCAGRDIADKDFFGHAPTEQHANFGQHLIFVQAETVFLGQGPSHPQCPPAWNYRDFMHGIATRQCHANHRVARFVIRGLALIFRGNHHGFALGAHENFIFRAFEIFHIDKPLIAARGEQRRFIHQVGQISARHTGGAARENIGTHIRRDRYFAHMHHQNLLTTANVRQRHHHLAIKTTGAQ